MALEAYDWQVSLPEMESVHVLLSLDRKVKALNMAESQSGFSFAIRS